MDNIKKRIKLTVEYDGTNYNGWQIQPGYPTVQGELTKALIRTCGHTVSVMGSGRTDEGVHAVGQVAHFDTHCTIPAERMREAANFYLPDDIKIVLSEEVPHTFHAMKGAVEKTYIYKVYNAKAPSPLHRLYSEHIPYNLDMEDMRSACMLLCGTHDFRCFMAAGGKVKSTVRTIFDAQADRCGNEITFTICGNGFLYNMVRIIVGTLLEVGRGRLHANDIPEIISSRDRTRAGKTVPPQGLYLLSVKY